MRCYLCGYLLGYTGLPGVYYACEEDGYISIVGTWCNPHEHSLWTPVAIHEAARAIASLL